MRPIHEPQPNPAFFLISAKVVVVRRKGWDRLSAKSSDLSSALSLCPRCLRTLLPVEQNPQLYRDGAGEDKDNAVSPTAEKGAEGPQTSRAVSRRPPRRWGQDGTIRMGRRVVKFMWGIRRRHSVYDRGKQNLCWRDESEVKAFGGTKHVYLEPPNFIERPTYQPNDNSYLAERQQQRMAAATEPAAQNQ